MATDTCCKWGLKTAEAKTLLHARHESVYLQGRSGDRRKEGGIDAREGKNSSPEEEHSKGRSRIEGCGNQQHTVVTMKQVREKGEVSGTVGSRGEETREEKRGEPEVRNRGIRYRRWRREE